MSATSTPIDQRGYAHPEFLVSTEWLSKHLDDPKLQVVDCNRPENTADGHIPGASLPSDNYYKRSSDRLLIAPPDEFDQMMRALRVSNDTLVIAYDSDANHLAPRLFWALNYYGHTNVKVLDGGLAAWLAEGRPIESGPHASGGGTFKAGSPQAVAALREDVLREIGNSQTVFWDVRADDEWTGENARGTARGGRIPGASHLEWKNLVTGGDVPVFKSSDELTSLLTGAGVTPDKNIVPY
jgi:thiosulfate/3-mercaptopyruvate sulfurtransferase